MKLGIGIVSTKGRQKNRSRKRKSDKSSTNVRNEDVTNSRIEQQSSEAIACLQWLQQDFANLYEEKTKHLYIQESSECRIRSAKLTRLTTEQVEDAKLQKRDSIERRQIAIKRIDSIQPQLQINQMEPY